MWLVVGVGELSTAGTYYIKWKCEGTRPRTVPERVEAGNHADRFYCKIPSIHNN